jgi:hypothetical protein
MDFITKIREGVIRPRVAIYLKVVAVIMLLGALSHLSSIMGFVGGSWADKPWYFRTADVVLLLTDLAVFWGLWRTRFWGVVAWVGAVIFLQAVPMLLLIQFATPDPRLQATWYGMLVMYAVMLGVFLLLLPRKSRP